MKNDNDFHGDTLHAETWVDPWIFRPNWRKIELHTVIWSFSYLYLKSSLNNHRWIIKRKFLFFPEFGSEAHGHGVQTPGVPNTKHAKTLRTTPWFSSFHISSNDEFEKKIQKRKLHNFRSESDQSYLSDTTHRFYYEINFSPLFSVILSNKINFLEIRYFINLWYHWKVDLKNIILY